ncbi:3-deoxy-manno-octulosonate cytidylyltransferase [uncultured Polaribacter sp.]|uniref:3-deoxy-manno-octulosonate cytidylyltransferase n=1 Tax=uncultured Polaribacter sp. TaxID=174711 RepID=UPI0026347505|nr:3-deoxy-manno-octulosonate cytidylyltransferase [uncultured Polaribacter sp.]
MKRVIIIPARLNSSRLPNKVLLDLEGKTVLQRVFDQCVKVQNVITYIATDSELIREECLTFTDNIIMTKTTHDSGTERVIEAVLNLDCNVVVNVQGDEPFINPLLIENLFQTIEKDSVLMASVKERITEKKDLINSNSVKVITDKNNNALYFSRSVIPFFRDGLESILDDNGKISSSYFFYRHVGIYAYKKSFLCEYSNLNEGYLEKLEKLEQLRVLENGIKIKMIETSYKSIGIDTKDDYYSALKIIRDGF